MKIKILFLTLLSILLLTSSFSNIEKVHADQEIKSVKNCNPSNNQNAALRNEATIQKFQWFVRANSESPSAPLSNVRVDIYGVNSTTNQRFLITDAQSDSTGTISNIHLLSAKSFDKIFFRFYMGNSNRGYIVDLNDYYYVADHTQDIPDNGIINTTRYSSPSSSHGDGQFYYQLTLLNNTYDEIHNNQLQAIESAKPYIHTSSSSTAPIKLIYDKNLEQDQSSFNRNGKGSVNEPVICINVKNDTLYKMKSEIAHEWAHWNMYRVTGMPGGTYESHDSYNENPQVSYKEGWALFQRHRFTEGWNNEFLNDTQVQDNPNLLGTSTNFTVKGALYDIFDDNMGTNHLDLENDKFSIYDLFVHDGNNHTADEKSQISEGIMYALMTDSKATTFKEFYQYFYDNYIIPGSSFDMELQNSMKINGIDETGQFSINP